MTIIDGDKEVSYDENDELTRAVIVKTPPLDMGNVDSIEMLIECNG